MNTILNSRLTWWIKKCKITQILIIFFLGSVDQVFSQNTPLLYEIVSSSSVSLSHDDSVYYHNIISSPSVVDYQFIKLMNVIHNQDEGILHFRIDYSESIDTLVAFAMDVKYVSSDEYIWKAEIPEYDGSMMIIKDSMGIYGHFIVDTISLEFYTFNDSISLMVRHMGIDSLTVDSDQDTTQNIASTECSDVNECASEIKILFLIPTDANDWYVNTSFRNSSIISMVEELNTAFQRSNISHRVSFVIEDFNWSYPQLSMNNDAFALAQNQSAIDKRNNNKADIVIMLSNHNYPSSSTFGHVATIGPSNSLAYGIVSTAYAKPPSYTFVHEVGHLFGAQHPDHIRDKLLCERNWQVITNRFYTVMTPYPGSKSKQILLNFSDPAINFKGYPTGSMGTGSPAEYAAINAGVIRTTGCTVGGFQGSTGLAVMINGDNRLCDDPEVYQAMVTPPPSGSQGQPPYNYEWRWNYDGIFTSQNPGTLLSSTSDVVGLPPPNLSACTFFFIKVKATSGQISGEAIKRIETSCTPCPYNDLLFNRSNSNKNKLKFDGIKVYPNPSSNDVNIEWYSDTHMYIDVMICDINGKVLSTKKIQSNLGNNKIQISENIIFNSGVHFLKWIEEDRIINHTILINK